MSAEFDKWHGILIGACGSLTSALGILWRELQRTRKDHLQDVKTLGHEAIELARAATLAPPLQPSAQRPPDSKP